MAKDVKMFYIDDDIKKIQTKTNMYIQNYGPEGAFHLGREIGQNDIDECIDPESNGKNIIFSYDKLTDKFTCEDDGRGFPEVDYPLDIFCTKNQSGSKFFRNQGGDSAGEFGVGMTVVNALSDEFVLRSYREIEKTIHTIKFRNGEKVTDEIERMGNKGKQHGSLVSFIPSKKYLGANTVFPYKDMMEWVNKMTYFIRKKDLTITFNIYEGLTLVDSKVYKPKDFDGLLEDIVTNTSYSPKLVCCGDTKIREVVRESSIDPKTKEVIVSEKEVEKNVHLDFALRYVDESITFFDSYCNYTHTVDGGVHQDTVEKCFCNYMQNKTKASMTDAQKEKTPILWDDVRFGLCCVVNLSSNAQIGFVGNAKTKIAAANLVAPMTELINAKLDEFFKEHPKVLGDYIKIIKLNAKSRIEAAKVRVAVQKETMNSFKEHEMKNYIRCVHTGKQWKELFIVEGDSPAGTARNACDPLTQAFFLCRGVTANAFKKTLSELMGPNGNVELKNLVTVLRCGIGPSFKLSKLYFNRINIFTDQDADGFYISADLLGFFYLNLPEIIKAGKLYKVFTPLYSLDDKEHPFVANKAEMVELYHKKIVKNFKIEFIDCSYSECSNDDLREFLQDAYDYRENLIRISKGTGNVDKFLIECVLAYMVMTKKVRSAEDYDDLEETFNDQKFIKTLMSRVQKRYPEITLKGQTLTGIADGKFCSLKVNNRLIKKASDLIGIYRKYGLTIRTSEKCRDTVDMSIGKFLDICQKYFPKIIERYKGLGEIDKEDLASTSLDPAHRISVQYTMTMAEEELELFNVIHSPEKKYAKLRKQMMLDYKVRRDDLDN